MAATTRRTPRGLQLLAAASVAVEAYGILRQRLFRLGATRAEAVAELPGDDLVAGAQLHGTRAVTIDAPPAEVWPWIAQLGYRRAGWYAFDSADDDKPVGEEGYTVVDIEPARHLVLAFDHPRGQWIRKGGLWPRFGRSSRAFVLKPLDGGRRTRLIARLHFHVPLGLHLLWWPLFEATDLVLQPLMLRRIKERVEGKADARDGAARCAPRHDCTAVNRDRAGRPAAFGT